MTSPQKRKRKYTNDFSEAFGAFKKEILKLIADSSSELKSELASIRQEYQEIKRSVSSLTEVHSTIMSEMIDIKSSLQFTTDQCDNLKVSVDDLSRQTGRIQCLELELNELRAQNLDILGELNKRDQRDRLNNLEIHGIPELSNENLHNLVVVLAQKSGVNISLEEIVSVNRVSPRIRINDRPKAVIVKFKSKLNRDNVIAGARKNRITTGDIGIPGSSMNVYANEHLTPYNKQLFKKCKEAAKVKKYQYVWTKNCKIFVRKNDTMHAVPVMREEDIKKIV